MVFSPHPDDDILACGGTIALAVQQGYEVYIIYMTDGRNSHLHELGITSNPSPTELAEIRKEEAIRALSILGVGSDTLLFLDFEDATLEDNLDATRVKVKQILESLRPQEVYFPTSKEKHRDHLATHILVSECLKTSSFPVSGYQYSIWGEPDELIPFNERKAVHISAVLTLKKKAIREHRSQIAKLSPVQEHPILDKLFIKKFLVDSEIFVVWKGYPESSERFSNHIQQMYH